MKRFFYTPEITLIGLGMFWITEKYLSTGRIGYITLLVTWLLFLQIFYKNRICGFIYGSVLIAISCYKLYTTYLKIGQIATFELIEMFFIFGLALIMSVSMIFKYARAKENYGESVLTVTD